MKVSDYQGTNVQFHLDGGDVHVLLDNADSGPAAGRGKDTAAPAPGKSGGDSAIAGTSRNAAAGHSGFDQYNQYGKYPSTGTRLLIFGEARYNNSKVLQFTWMGGLQRPGQSVLPPNPRLGMLGGDPRQFGHQRFYQSFVAAAKRPRQDEAWRGSQRRLHLGRRVDRSGGQRRHVRRSHRSGQSRVEDASERHPACPGTRTAVAAAAVQ